MLRRACLLMALTTASLAALATSPAVAEPRLALVIGQGAYAGGDLPTAVNDAGLVAQTLTGAGFEVVQGRDLGTDDLRAVVKAFLDKVQGSAADTSVVVYVAGHALQMDGDNFIVPVDARIKRETDVAYDSLRLSDLTRALAAAPGQTRVVVLDAARAFPTGDRSALSRGLAIVDPAPGFLLALASAPGATAPEGAPPYGAFATALVETMREPGIGLDALFSRVRLQVHEATEGRQTPFHASNLHAPFTFFEPEDVTASVAPPPEAVAEGGDAAASIAAVTAVVATSAAATPAAAAEPTRKVAIPEAGTVEEAYALAINTDTIEGYQEFLKLHAETGYARRVKTILAARREATVWRKTVAKPSPTAYWTYLKTYPAGAHASDCRRGLSRLGASVALPADFEAVVYEDIPRPLPVEVVEVVTAVDAPRPPPPPIYLLPRRPERIVWTAPPPPSAPGVLPVPIPLPPPFKAKLPGRFIPPIAPATPGGRIIPVIPPILQRPSRPDFPRPIEVRVPGQPGRPFPGGVPRPFPIPAGGEANGRPGSPSPLPLPLPGSTGPVGPRPFPFPRPNGDTGPIGPRPLPLPGQAGGLPLPSPNGNTGPFLPRPRPIPGELPPVGPGAPGPTETGAVGGRPRVIPLPGGGVVRLPPGVPFPGGGRGPLPGRPPVQDRTPAEARLPGPAGPVVAGERSPIDPRTDGVGSSRPGSRFPGRFEAGSRFPTGADRFGSRLPPVLSERRLPDTARPPVDRPAESVGSVNSRLPATRPGVPSRFERFGPVAREPRDPAGPPRFEGGPSRRNVDGPAVRQGLGSFERRTFGSEPGFGPGPRAASPRSFEGPAFRPQNSFRQAGPSFRPSDGGRGRFDGGGSRGGDFGGNSRFGGGGVRGGGF